MTAGPKTLSLAVSASQVFAIISGTLGSGSPGYISWTSVVVQYKGVQYSITNGTTNSQWVYWQLASPTVFSTAASFPSLGVDDYVVGLNVSGTFVSVWSSGKAINASSITAGTITAITYKTGASGQRVEIDSSNGIRAFNSSGNVVAQFGFIDATYGLKVDAIRSYSGVNIGIDANGGDVSVRSHVGGMEMAMVPSVGVFAVYDQAGSEAFYMNTTNFYLKGRDVVVEQYLKLMQATTGGGTPLLGTNCPASTLTGPVGWFKMKAPDGSVVYVPAWQ
jgi:hypothetical protein